MTQCTLSKLTKPALIKKNLLDLVFFLHFGLAVTPGTKCSGAFQSAVEEKVQKSPSHWRQKFTFHLSHADIDASNTLQSLTHRKSHANLKRCLFVLISLQTVTNRCPQSWGKHLVQHVWKRLGTDCDSLSECKVYENIFFMSAKLTKPVKEYAIFTAKNEYIYTHWPLN